MNWYWVKLWIERSRYQKRGGDIVLKTLDDGDYHAGAINQSWVSTGSFFAKTNKPQYVHYVFARDNQDGPIMMVPMKFCQDWIAVEFSELVSACLGTLPVGMQEGAVFPSCACRGCCQRGVTAIPLLSHIVAAISPASCGVCRG